MPQDKSASWVATDYAVRKGRVSSVRHLKFVTRSASMQEARRECKKLDRMLTIAL
jgi:hypothetical protein